MASASRGRDAARAQQLLKIHAVHQFHEKKIEAVGLAEFVERDDVGMVQAGQGAGFAGESFGEAGAPGHLGGRIFSATIRPSCFCRAR